MEAWLSDDPCFDWKFGLVSKGDLQRGSGGMYVYIFIYLKHQLFNGCFNWMIQNEKRLFHQTPIKTWLFRVPSIYVRIYRYVYTVNPRKSKMQPKKYPCFVEVFPFPKGPSSGSMLLFWEVIHTDYTYAVLLHPGRLTWTISSWRFGSDHFPF